MTWIKDTLIDTARTAISVAIIMPITGAILIGLSRSVKAAEQMSLI